MTARLLMIGLDAADGSRLDRWSADGTLPALTALRASGAGRRLTPAQSESDDGLWASFQYAAGPGEHGRYHSIQRLSDGRFGLPHSEETGRDAFWDRLSNQGRRVAILDVPKCRAPRPLNGIHLTDWLVHGRTFETPLSHPPALAAETVARFGPPPPSRCGYRQAGMRDDDVMDALAGLKASVAQKRAAGLHHLTREAWDLFVIVFKEAHCCGHAFWDLADPQHPDHDPPRAARLGDPVLAVLRAQDEAIGALVVAAGPEAEVLVFSTSDMAPNGSLQGLFPRIVVRLNKRLAANGAGHVPPNSGWRCRMLPAGDAVGALRIAHEPRLGGGAPGADDAVAVGAEIARLLDGLRDLATGDPVIQGFAWPSRALTGPRAADLPDLVAHYRQGSVPAAVGSSELGRISAGAPRVRAGNHAAGGFLIARGQRAVAAAAGVNEMRAFGALAERLLCQTQSASQSAGV